MSGLAAMLFKQGRADPARVTHMHAAAPHRGARIEVVTQGACVLAVSNGETTEGTLAAADGLAAAIAGCLDNVDALADALVAAGQPLPRRDPAHVLLAAFRQWGEAAPVRLRGVFSAAVSDGARLWALRDHVGLSPLFYREDDRIATAAVEAKQVLAGAGLGREPDLEVVEQIFYGRLIEDAPCALRSVSRLPKASVIRFEAGRPAAVRRYWQPETLFERSQPSPPEIQEGFDALMAQAVTRMMKDADVVSLSGGIDSCAVAAFAAPIHRQRTGRPLAALSAVFPDLPAVDESRYITQAAESLGISVQTYRPAAQRLDRLDAWGRLFDGPVPTVSISEIEENYRVARSLGGRTILTGDLGEFVYDMRRHLLAHLLWRGRFGALARQVRSRRSAGAPWRKIAFQMLPAVAPPPIALAFARARSGDDARRLPPWINARKANEVPYRDDLTAAPAQRWRQQQLLGFIGPGLSIEADEIVATLCGVRVRRPLADVDLWEFFLSLPAEVKFPDHRSKTLVRSLLRGRVPDAILDRPDKTVFNDFAMSQIDYPSLRRWLLDPPHRIAGVKYDVLADRLRRETFGLVDWIWANDLARIHAFLSEWTP